MLPRMGFDPVMVQTFDMVLERGAQDAVHGSIVKRFHHEYTPIDTNDVTTWSLVLIRVY
jgi:hypothetical protein